MPAMVVEISPFSAVAEVAVPADNTGMMAFFRNINTPTPTQMHTMEIPDAVMISAGCPPDFAQTRSVKILI